MWIAACLTITLAPLGPPAYDLKIGYGHYHRGPNAHFELRKTTADLVANARPGQIYRPMAQFLRCN